MARKLAVRLVLTHDVDTRRGYENVVKLADLEESLGFRSNFNFFPERYGEISLDLIKELKYRGFDVAFTASSMTVNYFFPKKYLTAVCQRSMRIFAPGKSGGLPPPPCSATFNG